MRLVCRDLSFDRSPLPVVLTPNRLFAEVLSAGFTHERLQKKQATWERPVITTVYAWLSSLWQNARYSGADVPNLLSPTQELVLWCDLFEQRHPKLFDFQGAARLAVEATRMLAEWHIPIKDDAWEEYKDASHFRSLYQEFRAQCRDRNCITRSDLWRLAPRWLKDETQRVALAGFEEMSPALRALPASHHPLLVQNKRSKRVPAVKYEKFSDEVEYCARWSRRAVETDDIASIGVLVPSLSEHRSLLERTFTAVFYPSGTTIPSAFHIHSVESLDSQPLITAALLFLEIAENDLATSDGSAILRSPFLTGAEQERNARALADLRLRSNRDLRVSRAQLEHHTASCPLLQAVWKGIHRTLRNQPHSASLSAWSEWISALLCAMGWPGERGLDFRESETLDAWNDALTQLSSLSFVVKPIPFKTARLALRRILSSMSGPQEGDLFSPVQIVDANRAAGIAFDVAAAIGFSDAAWPVAEPGQPFIPLRLRRQAGVPGSTPALLASARAQSTRRVFHAAVNMIASFTDLPAPLATPHLNLKSHAPQHWDGPLPITSFAVTDLISLEDEWAPPLPQDAVPRGGVNIIKAQSQCPFQAFARYRLLTDVPEDPCFGLDARERGTFLHESLRRVWRTLETSEHLKAMPSEELRSLVSEAVSDAVRDTQSSPFHELVNRAERERLISVILEWLELEKCRKVPFRVEHIEEERAVQFAGLPLKLRIDRIDRLQDGSALLIDYKSGLLNAKHLVGDRPREPQLLVYASAVKEEVDGVYLAQVRAREIKALGMATRDHFPASSKAKPIGDWFEEREKAREKLEGIAKEFVAGCARVDPQPEACTYCPAKPICRVAESGGGSEGGDGDE